MPCLGLVCALEVYTKRWLVRRGVAWRGVTWRRGTLLGERQSGMEGKDNAAHRDSTFYGELT